MSEQQNSNVYIATQTAHVTSGGQRTIIRKGVTRVREGHELLDAYPGMFKRADQDLQFDVEDALSRPQPSSKPTTARAADAAATELKGAALDQALDDAGLPKTGKVAEKQARLAEHLKAQAAENAANPADGEDNGDGGQGDGDGTGQGGGDQGDDSGAGDGDES